MVVGYDDNKYGGAFEIMNSWEHDLEIMGSSAKYADFKKYIKTAYVLLTILVRQILIKIVELTVIQQRTVWRNYFKLSNGKNMAPRLLDGAKRNFNIVKVKKTSA